MTSTLVKVGGDFLVGTPATMADGTPFYLPAVGVFDPATGLIVSGPTAAQFPASLGPKTDATSFSVVPSTSQNPIFDHANGTKTSVTTSATIITPPAGCQFLRISTDVDIFVNTAGNTAVDDGTSIRLVANAPEVIPVTAATAVKALSSSGTATVRCTPLKVR